MDSTLKDAIAAHALECYPFEACGLVVGGVYRPCRNISETPHTAFSIAPEDYADAEDAGPIDALVHSHPGGTAMPSQGDLTVCEELGVPKWVIVSLGAQADGSVAIEAWHEFGPSGFEAPLIGCEFSHGTNDCFGLVRRYYWQTYGIALPDFHRSGEWWNDGKSSLYTDNYAACGGVSLPLNAELREGDVLLMKIRSRNNTPNHAAVYIGNDTIIHHLWGQLSRRDALPRYRDFVTHIIRYREALG
ncbi:C40 family peptidase [Burkholderia vietnamiensis]|uniref:C40 family peptidase n=1 Tax=Burkholderia vietnamiensis TaxID=60552 RepID=UPI000756D990|nr:C40 family peptidase [Burkholderia vietnamiensis]KVR97198.1 hydrolase Nlp/P60 [Burkholderia vietnamiensis]